MPKDFTFENKNTESSVIAGRNAVTEALKKGRPIDCIYILKGAERGSMGKIIALAKENGIPIKDAAQQKLDTLCDGVVHQGVAAMAACHDFSTMEDIFAKAGDQPPFIIICDNIEDPHNLGAIIRTAEAAGAHGVIIPKRRGVGLTATVAKTSAGWNICRLSACRISFLPLRNSSRKVCGFSARIWTVSRGVLPTWADPSALWWARKAAASAV